MSTSQSTKKIKNVCVFCGSSLGKDKAYLEAANHLGQVLARKKINIIYGGGSIKMMVNMALAARSSDATDVRIWPHIPVEGNLCKEAIGKGEGVRSIPKNFKDIIYNSDAFIALPGGLGTLEEIFIVACGQLLGFYSKPLGLLNVKGFYDGLLKFLDYAVEENITTESERQIFVTASTAEELIDKMQIIHPESDTATSKLEWERESRERPIDLNLHL